MHRSEKSVKHKTDTRDKINTDNESEDELNMLNDKLGDSEIDVGQAAAFEP